MSNEIEPVYPSESNIVIKTAKKPLALPLPPNQLPHSDRYKNERIRQAQWSFNFLLGFATLVPITLFTSISLYLIGNVPAATQAAAATGTLGGVTVFGRKLYKDANDRLDNTAAFKDEEQSNLD